MAFTFSLAAVLSVRRRREEAEEAFLAKAAAELDAARQTLARIEAELQRLALERAAETPRLIQASDLHERYVRFALLENGRAEVLALVRDLTQQFAMRQQAYLQARRDREILEELETSQRAVYTAGLLRHETKRNEDAFLSRYLRN